MHSGMPSSIMNISFKEQEIPTTSPILKAKQPQKRFLPDLTRTYTISKIAKYFIVLHHIKPAVMKIVDPNQFGTISNYSTTLAIISMLIE